jgi:hypothetical protein
MGQSRYKATQLQREKPSTSWRENSEQAVGDGKITFEPARQGMRWAVWVWVAGFLFLAAWMFWDLIAALLFR